MQFSLDPYARSPLYQQIKDQIRYALSVGDLTPGDTLPSIREVEARFDVNRNTVRRAYLELQAEGSIAMRQGREAVVAERPLPTPAADPTALAEIAAALSDEALQRAESNGLDSIQFAAHLACIARAHDATYPKCAFLECSMRQADHFARQAQRQLGRSVIGIDLHDLREDPNVMPASVRHVFTPHWHIAEANELVDASRRTVSVLGVRISAQCGRELRALEGESIGLVVRDPESAPGFQELLRTHMGRRSIAVTLCDDHESLAAMAAKVDHIVHTSPCAEAVREVAPPRVGVHELVFEPTPEDLDAVGATIFPELARQMQTV